jgi:hypothetical protein
MDETVLGVYEKKERRNRIGKGDYVIKSLLSLVEFGL